VIVLGNTVYQNGKTTNTIRRLEKKNAE